MSLRGFARKKLSIPKPEHLNVRMLSAGNAEVVTYAYDIKGRMSRKPPLFSLFLA